jgi:hypothetical protein
MVPDIIAVSFLQDYKLLLEYENGEKREYDCEPILGFKPYNMIVNPFVFRLVSVEFGSIVWPNGVDIAPETLYHDSLSRLDLVSGNG